MRHTFIYLSLFSAFILGAHKGDLALWLSPGGQPDYVFPYSVSALPPEDQQRLKDGIRIESKDELIGLLEDYLS
jgi:hypothetical protein